MPRFDRDRILLVFYLRSAKQDNAPPAARVAGGALSQISHAIQDQCVKIDGTCTVEE